MPLSSIIARSAATSQNNQVYEAQIKNLEKQKEQLAEKINKLRQQDSQPGSQQIQQEIPAYEVQLQSIEAQIEHLEQKQASLETTENKSNAAQSTADLNMKKAKKQQPPSPSVDING